jgi:fumarate reductase flavoprotein subunit
MAAWVKKVSLRDPDQAAIVAAVARCEPKSAGSHGSLEPLRDRLYEVMWEKVGIIRDRAGLESALSELSAIADALAATGIADSNRAFNLTWHDWLNLKNLVATSQVIAQAALAREDSRGAHYREDFPEAGPMEASSYTSAQLAGERLEIGMKPVAFTRVRPGESLIR